LRTHFGEKFDWKSFRGSGSLNSTFLEKEKMKKNRFYFDETDLSLHSIATIASFY
jgi:hypothetical protein